MPYLFPESATDLVLQLGVHSFPEGQRYGARLEETRLDVRVYVDADFPASIAAQLLLETSANSSRMGCTRVSAVTQQMEGQSSLMCPSQFLPNSQGSPPSTTMRGSR